MMEFIFGSAGLIIFYFLVIQIIEALRKKEPTIIDINQELRRRKLEEQIHKVNNELIDKRKAYEKQKEELYEAIKKRDDNNGDPRPE